MDEARKARAVGFNHVALEVDDRRSSGLLRSLFDFKLRGKSGTEPSSIWATNSSRCKRAAPNRLTRDVILGL